MAHFDEHCNDCERILGIRFEEVNKWIDQAFAQFGPRHRRVKHHWEGVNKAEELFGVEGRKAALIHILKDCGHIPHVQDYDNGAVDFLGIDEGIFNGFWDAKQFTETAKKLLAEDDKVRECRRI